MKTRESGVRQSNVVPFASVGLLTSVELFSGCGGLALGLSKAGLSHKLLVELDKHACSTLRVNASKKLDHFEDWQAVEDDVRNVDWSTLKGVDVVAGGPPCQPFSIGGRSSGSRDKRDMWPEAIRAIREIRPKAFVFENVRGLLRPAFSGYVSWLRQYLSLPHLVRSPSESHKAHLLRLESELQDAIYDVRVVPVNAADYGIPQKRHRVIVVGVRRDLGLRIDFPDHTHSQERLVWDKWVTAEYWKRHGLRRPSSRHIPLHENRILIKLDRLAAQPREQAWRTCRDAFLNLGEPGTRTDPPNHKYQHGAKSYAGHSGSPIDEPAKALKAGVHGVPGGENMLARHDGTVRYFSVREAARLQGFPDEMEFQCSWTEAMRQIGNAVPVPLARVLGYWLVEMLSNPQVRQRAA